MRPARCTVRLAPVVLATAVVGLVTVEDRFAAPAKMLVAPDSINAALLKVTAAEVRKYPTVEVPTEVVWITGLSTRIEPD